MFLERTNGRVAMASPESVTVAHDTPALREASRITLLSCALFVVIGVVTPILGPILPFLPGQLGVTSVEAGQLFFWQFTAATCATLTATAVLSRVGFRALTATALVLVFIGVGGLQTSHWRVACAAVACYGVGLGFSIPAINLTVSRLNPARRSSMLCILNCCWVRPSPGGLRAVSPTCRIHHGCLNFERCSALSRITGSAWWHEPREAGPVLPWRCDRL